MTDTLDEKFYRAKITKRVDFSHDLWSIRIHPTGEFKFAPGQYATLGIEGALMGGRVDSAGAAADDGHANVGELVAELS